MDLRDVQRPLKERYREDPDAARITLAPAGARRTAGQLLGGHRAEVYEAQAHQGVGGPGTAACSGDLLLGALAACAQVTCQMVAATMGIASERIEVTVEGDLDLRGTLGVDRDVTRRLRRHPGALRGQRAGGQRGATRPLHEKAERYCTVSRPCARRRDLDDQLRGPRRAAPFDIDGTLLLKASAAHRDAL